MENVKACENFALIVTMGRPTSFDIYRQRAVHIGNRTVSHKWHALSSTLQIICRETNSCKSLQAMMFFEYISQFYEVEGLQGAKGSQVGKRCIKDGPSILLINSLNCFNLDYHFSKYTAKGFGICMSGSQAQVREADTWSCIDNHIFNISMHNQDGVW